MKLTAEDAVSIAEWYKENKRDLPWRDTGDPYDVWLSEIMLQQTRVEAVKEYFRRFKLQLPDIRSLAECDDDRLMRLWEGLGYYSRARNLKKGAVKVMDEFHGVLPDSVPLLKTIPGVGPYTAGAIAAIAFARPVPAVDGNVLRVIARRFNIRDDIRDQKTRDLVTSLISGLYETIGDTLLKEDPAFPSVLTQSFMELGALVCLPNGAPHCKSCPWQERCAACREGTTAEVPYRSGNKERKIVRRTLFIIRDGSLFLLRKRPEKGLLAGLYEFPGADGFLDRKEAEGYVRAMGYDPLYIKVLPEARHIFTHLEWHMQAYEVRVAAIQNTENILLLNKKELAHYAIPSAFKTYTDYYSLRD